MPHAFPLLVTLLFAVSRPPAPGAQDPLASRSKGDAAAPVVVYEMSDFQCPFCKRHAEQTFPALEREFVQTGKVRWVFINYPLTQIHPNAVPAAEVAMCAARQGGFWPVHDLLFRHQQVWSPLKEPGAFFLTLADSAGLNKAALTSCLQRGEVRDLVRADAEGAARSGATSTPTFYIEGGLLQGAAPTAVFRQVLDSVYRVKVARKTGGG